MSEVMAELAAKQEAIQPQREEGAAFYPSLDTLQGELERISPLVTLFKSVIDPVLVVATLYLLHRLFDVAFGSTELVLAALAFLLTMLVMDGSVLLVRSQGLMWWGLLRFVLGWCFVVATLSLIGYLASWHLYFYPPYLLAWALLAPATLLASHGLVQLLMGGGERVAKRKVAIVGANEAGMTLRDRIGANGYLNMEFVGFFDDRELTRLDAGRIKPGELLATLAGMAEVIQREGISHVYISLPMSSQPRVMSLLDCLQDSTVSIYFVPDYFVFDMIQGHVDNVAGIPVVCVCDSPFTGLKGVVKRAEDIVLTLAILALIWPLMLGTALAVKLTSPGPVIFRQKRYGMDGKSIVVYKFRSMTVMEDGDKVVQARQGDQRFTPIGGFLRKSSLDELPQFINVLEGKMSIVGPRPHANTHNEYYRKLIKGYMIRHKVRPGITGWAQVNGCRGETDTLDKMEKRIEFDLAYLRHWSLWMDLRIVLMTAYQTVKPKGNAY